MGLHRSTTVRAIPLSSFSSRSRGLAAPDRIDPYYADLFELGASTKSFSISRLRETRLRAAEVLRPSLTDEADLLRGRHREDLCLLLGALHGWRGLLPQQAAALIGRPLLASVRRPTMIAALRAGLIDVGIAVKDLPGVDIRSDRAVWRASRETAIDRLTAAMTSVERASVLGGRPWREAPSYDRHLVLSAELGLRAAEYLPWVGTVLGEQFAGIATMSLQRASSMSAKEFETKSADLVIVRADGLRIAVEVTATASRLEHKVRMWADLLHANRVDQSGVVVLFVAADRGDRNVRGELEKVIRKVCDSYALTRPDVLHDRLLVASWSDWFPKAHAASTAFADLTASAYTASRMVPRRTVSLAAASFQPADDWSPTAVIDNAALLCQTPAWLRAAATPPDPATLLVRRAGLARSALGVRPAEMVPPARLRWPGL